MADTTIALQLFTVRDKLAEDYAGTLAAVRDAGYPAVELAGRSPYSVEELRSRLDELGLSVAGTHVPADDLAGDFSKWIDYAQALGTTNMICGAMPKRYHATKDDWLEGCAMLEEAGERCGAAGMRLSYHNHSFEFQRFDGTYALDLLYENTSPESLYAELDTYWVQHGGADPTEYIRKLSGRISILHVKDMADDEERSFAPVGSGILDWPAIHAASQEAGVDYYCVEQDRCQGDSLDCARQSRKFLSGLLGG